MTRTVFIHVGLPKTGTTSIQKSLAASRDVLSRHGISYPGKEIDHANLIALFHPKGPEHYYFVNQSVPDPIRIANQLMTEALSAKGDLILSSEYLHNIGERQARKLHDTFVQAGFHAKFICYVRHPVDAAVSSAQQSIKMGDRSLAEVIAEPRYTQLRQNIEPFLKAVGKENLIVKDFKAATRDGLLKSFMTCTGRPDISESMTETFENEGLTMDAALFSDLYRTHLKETGKKLFSHSVVFQFTDGKFDLPPKAKAAIRRSGKDDVAWVESEFGIPLVESVHPQRFHPNPTLDSVSKVIQSISRIWP